ncbi:FeoA family protein [Planctomycetaceae bacterium SH139]
MTTLDQLKPGTQGRIVRIDGADGIAARLREMGFIPGAAVRAMRPAPFGDPLKCLIHGCRIALRSGEARRISIQPDG